MLSRLSYALYLILLITLLSPTHAGRTTRLTVLADGTEANTDSRYIGDVSSDGRYVVFASSASNLVANDINPFYDIFWRDLTTGEVRLVSKSTQGVQANGASYWPVISDNGRYVAFFSYASNLHSGDLNGTWDIFVHDTQLNTTTLVTQSTGGTVSNGPVESLAISGDGSTIAYTSLATNLIANDTNGTWDIYVWNNNTTERVSVSSSGAQADGASLMPVLSEDGRYVAFESTATNLVADDTNGLSDIFVHDRTNGTTVRASLSETDKESLLGDATTAAISGDGSIVAFVSDAADVVADDTNGVHDIFIRNLTNGTTVRVEGPDDEANGMCREVALSGNGSYLSFLSTASNLVSGDTNGCADVFRYSLSSGTIELVSVSDSDELGNNRAYARQINSTGQYILFLSYANNLVTGDDNNTGDVFLRDMGGTGAGTAAAGTTGTAATETGGSTFRASVDSNESEGDDHVVGPAGMSSDGRYVVFASNATDLVSGDTNNTLDVFLRDRVAGTTTRLSVGAGGVQANGASHSPAISADGSVVVFLSQATNLVSGDTNDAQDLFLYQAGTVSRLSVNTAGTAGSDDVKEFAISSDGRFIAFSSLSSNLVANDTNDTWDIFVRDHQLSTTIRVSEAADGTESNAASFRPSISSDGQLIAFESHATNLVANDTNGRGDIFVYNLTGPAVERVSVTQAGSEHKGGSSSYPQISADGSTVVFESMGWDLFLNDFNGSADVVIHTRSTNSIGRIQGSTESNGWSFNPRVSSDGRYVAFECDADNMITGDTNGVFDVFVYDKNAASISRASVDYQGKQVSGQSNLAAISADGGLVLFGSLSDALVPNDSNSKRDLFIRAINATSLSSEIAVTGNDTDITTGDSSPSLADHTDFGNSPLGTPVTRSFTITNGGTGYLDLTDTPAVELSGDAAFTVVTQPSGPLAPGQSAVFEVRFQPTTTGTHSATVSISSNDSDESPFTFSLQGWGQSPNLEVTGSTLAIPSGDTTPDLADGTDIGVALPASGTQSSSFILTNSGDYALTISGVTISGTDAGHFAVDSSPTSPLAASASETLIISFTPTLPGLHQATVTISSDDPDTPGYTFMIQGTGNRAPLAVADALTTNNRAYFPVELSALSSSDPDNPSAGLTYSWEYVSGAVALPGPALTDISTGNDMSEVSFTPTVAGSYTFKVTVSDGYATATDTVTVLVTSSTRLIAGTVLANTTGWTQVDLPYTYQNMVLACTLEYRASIANPPLVVRIKEAAESSFKVRLYRADTVGTAISDIPVHFIVAEEGHYNSADHGITMDAVRYTSSLVSAKNDRSGVTQHLYRESFTSPVVIGQIMSTADEHFQVFWAHGPHVQAIPNSTTLYTGRDVAESPVTTLPDEEVGFIVFESGTVTVDNVSFLAGVTGKYVAGMENGPYTINTGTFTPQAAVLGLSTLNGGDGGFPVLTEIGSNYLRTVIDEDVLGDSERFHALEQVAYVAFDRSSLLFPVAENRNIETLTDQPVDITLSALNVSGNETFALVGAPTSGSLTTSGSTWTYTPDSGFNGTDSFTYQAEDQGKLSTVATVTIVVKADDSQLLSGIVNGRTDAWVTVTLPRTYASMVAVCTPTYNAATSPAMIVRVRNASTNSFEIKVDRTDGISTPITGIPVHYAVAEEGVYTTAAHGVKMEVHKLDVSTLSRRNDWSGSVAVSYSNSYSNPVVIGQVLTTNDPLFQMFWAHGPDIYSEPTTTSLHVGRHIGESPNYSRAVETLGYMIFESEVGDVDGQQFEAGVTSDYIGTNPETWTLSTLSPEVTVLTIQKMDGKNGAFPVLYETPLLSNGFKLFCDEDQMRDGERWHTREPVAYLSLRGSHNVVPYAYNQRLSSITDTPLPITLTGASMSLGGTWTVVTTPANGTLSGSGESRVYTPNSGFTGTDEFTFTATNSQGTSEAGTVTITINTAASPINRPPEFSSVWAGPDPDALASPANLEVIAYDPNDTPVTVSWEVVSGPGSVTFSASSEQLSVNQHLLATAGAVGDVTRATFSEVGTYVLKTTASDGSMTETRELTVEVESVPATSTGGATGGGGGGGGGGCHLTSGSSLNTSILYMLVALVAGLGLIRRRSAQAEHQ